MPVVKNKYSFNIIMDCENGNPNGSPDDDNRPRTDFQTRHGLISAESLKRKTRDLGERLGEKIFVQHETNLNKSIFQARQETGNPRATPTKDDVRKAEDWMSAWFFDVRAFGAVMSSGPNGGRLTGPVQIFPATSIDPVQILDWTLTRDAVAKDLPNATSVQDYEKWEAEQPSGSMRTFGRKSFIPYGLYMAKGTIAPFEAQRTGFSEADLEAIFELMFNMFEQHYSSNSGIMTIRRIIIFRHVGTSLVAEERARQALMGCAKTQDLLELGKIISIQRIDPNRPPRAYSDYTVTVDATKIPPGVEMLDLSDWDLEAYRGEWVKTQKREPKVPSKTQ